MWSWLNFVFEIAPLQVPSRGTALASRKATTTRPRTRIIIERGASLSAEKQLLRNLGKLWKLRRSDRTKHEPVLYRDYQI